MAKMSNGTVARPARELDPAAENRTVVDGVDVLGSLSPSRASDFMTCPLLFRYRTIDRLPEPSSPDAVRGTVVHKVLEDLFDLPAAERTPDRANDLLQPSWEAILETAPEIAEMFSAEGPEVGAWLASCEESLSRYFALEDPTGLEPAEREMYVETLLDSKLLLRGFVDRLDVSPDRRDPGGRLQDRQGAARGLRSQGPVPDEVLRARDLADPRRRPPHAAADLPRERRGPALRARGARPAGHRAQARGALGGDRAGAGDR